MKFVMSDARAFTDYQPNCTLNAFLRDKYAPDANEHQFRYALQRNAETILKDLSAVDGTGCKFCPVCKESLTWKGMPLQQGAQYGFKTNPNPLT